MPKYTEKDTEKYYDSEDSIYQSFWDKEGSCHWGLFKNKENNYLKASEYLTDLMIEKSGINSRSKVLDLGCGNGEVTIQVAKKTGSYIFGVDLSGVRIKNAEDKLKQNALAFVSFKKASATNLPFKDGEFTHVWSQATIYHVHDKDKALSEVYRVLKKDGIFIFDDLTKPKKIISKESRKYVYDRLLFDTPFSFKTYQEALKNKGFKIIEAKEISEHLKTSYQKLIDILENKVNNSEEAKLIEKYKKLILAYGFTIKAVDKKELGWALFLCKK